MSRSRRASIISYILVFALAVTLLSSITLHAAETVASGTCGEDVTWTLSDSGLMVIRGTGDTSQIVCSEGSWSDYKSMVKSVSIISGVTGICESMLDGCSELKSVTVPDSVISIGDNAFGTDTKDIIISVPTSGTFAEEWAVERQYCVRIIDEAIIVGHNWDDSTYTWSNDNGKCTASRVCLNNSTHIETEVVDTSSSVIQTETETEPEIIEYKAIFVNSAFATQTKQIYITSGDDTELLEDYEYSIINDSIILSKYIGSSTNVVVPKAISLNNKKYIVSLSSDCSGFFKDKTMIESISFKDIDTRGVTNISEMFAGCSGLKRLDLSKCDLSGIVENITDDTDEDTNEDTNTDSNIDANYERVFENCSALEEISTPLNLSVTVDLLHTFVKKDDTSVEYTSLPKNQTSSVTILKKDEDSGGGDKPVSNNVQYVDEQLGIAIVKNGYTKQNDMVDLNIIKESKMYRMYNPYTYEHLYTKEESEVSYLIRTGWIHEAESDYTVVDARDSDAIPVYRLYNRYINTHHYTESVDEVEFAVSFGWTYERISHYVYHKNSSKGIPQWRLNNDIIKAHNWTSNESEIAYLEAAGWKNEGIRWNIIGSTTPLD